MSSEFLASLWKHFRGCSVLNHTPYCFMGINFVVHLLTTKTMKILPLEKYPLYGNYDINCRRCKILEIEFMQ